MDALTDPETLRQREDVAFVDAPPEDHQNHFEVYESIAGMAIAGVTDGDGRLLLLEHEQAALPALSYTRVDPGEDFVAAARDVVVAGTGIEARIDEPLRVRRCTYRSEHGAETTGYDVVFGASPVGDGDPDAGHDWTAAWRDPESVDLPDDEDNDVSNDIRLFL